jgi:phosphate transport system substrate-binding protein
MISSLPVLLGRLARPALLIAPALAFALGVGAPAASAAPAHVVITVPAAAPGAAGLPPLLADWRKNGLISDAYLLESTQAKGAPFAQVAVLEFPDEEGLARWQAKGAPAVGAGLIVTPVDRLSHGETFPRDSTKAIFVVTDYSVTAPPEKYRAYVEGYVTPEMEAMRVKKVLTSYFLYAAKTTAGAPWHAMLVAEYRDSVAYGRRTAVMAAVRKDLEANPEWKALSDAKAGIRKETSLTESAWDLLPAPALTDLPHYQPEYHVTGSIRVLGSYLKFATTALEDGFLKYQPDAQFANNYTTSSEGSIGGLCTGISDVAPAGDDAKISDMLPFYNVYGYLPLEISIATGDYEKRGALWPGVIIVNKDNPLLHISMDQLDRVFGSERIGGWDIGGTSAHNILYTAEYARGKETNIRTWGQLGLTGEWADKEIQTYGYAAPGFEVYFERKLLHWTDKWNENLREYIEPKQAAAGPGGEAVMSDRALEALSHDKYGIGWAAMFHAKFYPNLRVLAIAPGKTEDYVPYTPETVSNRTYPLTRDAYFYINREPGRPLDPKIREFFRFILSREGQEIIAHTGFFYPLPADFLNEQLKKLN